MPPPYRAHVFVCTNRRPDGSPKGCCASKGSEDLIPLFKREAEALGLKELRINKAGCLDACERGVSVCVYPEGVWYGGITKDDVREIVHSHLKGGAPVERLRMAPYVRKP